ncbi:MAG: hypothetical protein L0J62_10445 [Corynebacterium casei]|uniref:hypothetical protein n=1 Tax=Corynebacterium casei TaxID=160386 RepID=UPI0026471563|nr:hypothetical protein [Corynebacterium casei]MDN6286093.1 hypothetical protein [Corynebacterium casei]
MAKEWGISYAANFGGLESEEIWVTCDTEEQAHKGMEHFRKPERRRTISNLRLHVRHVTEWELDNG